MEDSLITTTPESLTETNSSEEFGSSDLDRQPQSAQEPPTEEDAVLRRAAAELAERKAELRALATLNAARTGLNSSFETISESLNDPSTFVRAAGVRALFENSPERATSFINNLIREGSSDQRHSLATAVIDSGLIEVLTTADSETPQFYSYLALLLLLAKAGEVEPLIEIIRNHPDQQLRLGLVKMLAASNANEVSAAFQELLIDPSLTKEIRAVVMETVVQLADNE